MCSIDIGIGNNFYSASRGGAPVTIMIQERITQVDPLLVVLYGITLIPLAEELRVADPGLLSQFHTEDAAFDRLAQKIA